jgi:hypothetical protein
MATPMTAAAILPHLERWQARHNDLERQMLALAALVGGSFDGPLFDAVWNAWNAYTIELGHRLHDNEFWLEWYADENDMGRKGLEVTSLGGRTMRVKNVRQLAKLIAENQPSP